MKQNKLTIDPEDFDLKNTTDKLIGFRNYLLSVEWQIDRCLSEMESNYNELQKIKAELSYRFNSIIDYINDYKNKEEK